MTLGFYLILGILLVGIYKIIKEKIKAFIDDY